MSIHVARATPDDDALDISYARLNAHIQHSPLAIIELDSAFRVTEWNLAAERMFGYSRAEMIGRHCQGLIVADEDSSHVAAILRRTVEERTAQQGQINRNRTRDGRVIWCEWNNTPLIDARGRLIDMAAMARDITDAIHTEHRLRTAEARYRGIFQNAVWGIFQTTRDGRYLDANPALAAIYGYESPKALLAELTDIGRQLYVEPGRGDEFLELMNRKGMVAGFESEVYRSDGSRIWISESCRISHHPDGTEYFEGTVEDISRRKAVEMALVDAKNRAEGASDAKSNFLANMSHELRTPLNAIIGFSEILVGEMFGSLGHAKYREYAADIMNSGSHLLNLINDILDMAKIEAGRMNMLPTPLDLPEVVDGTLRMIAPRAESASIMLARDEQDDLPQVSADPRAMKQILLNLLSNAVKFTPPQGTVTVQIRRQEGGVEMTVADTGIGMSPENIPLALEPFRQIESSLHRRFEGTGLGLALVRSLAELQGVGFSISSTLGKGTRATLWFPPALIVPGGP